MSFFVHKYEFGQKTGENCKLFYKKEVLLFEKRDFIAKKNVGKLFPDMKPLFGF